MKQKFLSITDIFFRFKQIRYLVAGGTATVVSLSTLFILTHFLNLWYVFSAVIAYLVSFFVSFYLQKFWTFKSASTKKIKSELSIYAVILTINLFLNTGIVFVLTDYFHFHYLFSQIIASLLLACISYFIYARLFKVE